MFGFYSQGARRAGDTPGPGEVVDYGAHLHWRVLVLANRTTNTTTAIQELEMRATPGGAQQCVGGTATGSSQFDFGSGPEKAFDGNYTNISSGCWASEDGAKPQWVAYQFPSAVKVLELAIWPQNRSDLASRAPGVFQLQYSDDGSSWSNAGTYMVGPAWVNGEPQTFLVTANPPASLDLDGSTLDGWATRGSGVSIESGDGSPSSPCWLVAHPGYMKRPIASIATGRVIKFRVKPRVGTLSLGTFFFGCNAQGAGPVLRIDARGASCGIGAATSWTAIPGPTQATRSTLTAGAWYDVEIGMTSATAGYWKLNGTTVGTFTVTINGPFIAFSGFSDVFITGPLWDSLETTP